MKVAILSTYDIDGGAAKAAFRLHKALRNNDIKSKMIVQRKTSGNSAVYEVNKHSFWNEGIISDNILLDIFYSNKKDTLFSTGIFGENILTNKFIKQADIIHLNWINNNFISIKSLSKIDKPIVWTLHDMWPFTGGCHYTGECEKYKLNCSFCPVLNSDRKYDLSNLIFNIKKKYYSKNITIVAPSKWLKNCASKSELFYNSKIVNIPYTLNTDIFKLYDRIKVRELFKIKEDKFVILFGAVNATGDKRKGYKYLKEAMDLLIKNNIIDNLEIVVFGANHCKNIETSKVTYRYIDKIDDEHKLAQIYSMSDAFVIPSLEDNLPNTILESLSCGTPVVGFDVGGIPDLIEHKVNGYLAKYKSVEDLVQGIYWIYKNNKSNWLGKKGRDKVVKNYSNDVIAKQYIDLYKSLLK